MALKRALWGMAVCCYSLVALLALSSLPLSVLAGTSDSYIINTSVSPGASPRLPYITLCAAYTSAFPFVSVRPENFLMWLDRIKLRKILGRDVQVVHALLNTTVTPPTIPNFKNTYQQMLSSYNCTFLIAAASDPAVATSLVGERAGIPTLVPLSSSMDQYQCSPDLLYMHLNQADCVTPGARRFQWSTGTLAPAQGYTPSFINTLKVKKVKTVAILGGNLAIYNQSATATFQAAINYGLKVVYYPPPLPITYDEVAFTTIHLPALMKTNPDAVILLALSCVPYVQAMKRFNYLPKALFSFNCADQQAAQQALGPDIRFITTPVQWVQNLTGADYTESVTSLPAHSNWPAINADGGEIPSAMQFFNEYVNRFKVAPTFGDAAITAALEGLEGSILLANSTNPSLVQSQLNQYYAQSFYGILSSNRFGYNEQHSMINLQPDENGVSQIIGPLFAATADFVYPMPSWDERIYVHSMYSLPEEKAVVGVVIAFCLLSALFMAGLLRYSSSPVIRATSIPFSLIQLLGSMIAFIATLTWPVENDSTTCNSRIWIWTLGFHMFTDPLIAKAYRIASIFSNKFLLKRISNLNVLIHCTMLFAPQLILNIIWVMYDPLQIVIVQPDSLRSKFNRATCNSDSAPVFAAITMAYGGFLLLIACVLAYRVKDAYAMFNDAKPIAVSVYALTTSSFIVVALQFSIVGNEQSIFVMRSVLVCVAYGSACSLLFGNIIIDAWALATNGTIVQLIKNQTNYEPKPALLKSESNDNANQQLRQPQGQEMKSRELLKTPNENGSTPGFANSPVQEDAVVIRAKGPAAKEGITHLHIKNTQLRHCDTCTCLTTPGQTNFSV